MKVASRAVVAVGAASVARGAVEVVTVVPAMKVASRAVAFMGPGVATGAAIAGEPVIEIAA